MNAPYELWREDGILHLILNRTARIGMHEIKEILRIIKALDPVNMHPVMVLSDASANISNDARRLLQRSCRGDLKRSVAYVAGSFSDRISGDLFALVSRPTFPFKLVGTSNDAFKWFERSACS